MGDTPRARRKDATAQQALDAMGIDGLCARIEDGDSLAEIARDLGISKSVVTTWIEADRERSARAEDARTKSANSKADQALDVLKAIPDDAAPGAIARAREVASHLRWEAKMRNPHRYGDKMQVDAKVTLTNESTESLAAELAAITAQLGIGGTAAD